jgi:protein subunit release factor B
MPDYPVSPAALNNLQTRMEKVGLREADIDESFVRSGGPGGQNVNKVSTCVLLVHRPTGLSVRCQEERSQALNRFLARRRLLEKLEEKILGAESEKRRQIEKIRRQKRKRSRRAKLKVLEDKRRRSEVKENRRPPSAD